MIPVSSLVGGIAGAAGSVIGGIASNRARKKQMAAIDTEDRRIDQDFQKDTDFFNSEYYKNQLDRTENAAALRKAHDFFKERAGIDAKTAAVTGATPESVAASKKQYSNAYSNLVGNIASGASSQRDRIKSQYDLARGNYNQRKSGIFGLRNNMYENQINQYGNLTSNAANLGINSIMDLMPKTNKAQ